MTFSKLILLVVLAVGVGANCPPASCPFLTNGNGNNLPSATESLKVSPSGAMLMQDSTYMDLVAHMNRERIPERVVHAKGAGAYGYFTVTKDIRKYTKAGVFSAVGKKTDIFVRFSTGSGRTGSPDTVLETKGMAVKLYTEEGNWDITCLGAMTFGLRDPLLFVSQNHALGRNPRTSLRDPNTKWDFRILRPEQTYFIMQSYVVGLPDGYRHVNASAMNIFKFVNAKNESTFVKFFFFTDQGMKRMSVLEARRMAAANPDYYIEDLRTAISNGSYPSWNLAIQLMTSRQAERFECDPFDSTRDWPEETFPFMIVGKIVLNRNPEDYFTEVEYAAFCPSTLVPGVQMSPDPVLHGRAFSYTDAQRHRLGANFHRLKINKPINKVKTMERDGSCAAANDGINYFPNSFECAAIDPAAAEPDFDLDGIADRWDANEDTYPQAKLYLKRLSKVDRDYMIENIAMDLSNPRLIERLREGALKMFGKVDPVLEDKIRKRVSEIMGATS